MARLRFGLIGLGMAVAPHARSLQDLADGIELVHAFSPSPERRAGFEKAFGFPTCGRIEDIIDDPGLDAVMVLTPPNTHRELVERIAATGKHILLEKPLDIATARAEALVAACEAAGVTLAIMLQHRFKPAAERLAALLADGSLGPLIRCSTDIPLWRPQSYYDEPGRGILARDGGGVLLTQGIHTLDLMISLAGPVSRVCGEALTSPIHRMETEDLVAATLRFANGAVGTINATTACFPGFPERIDLICRHGTALLAGSSLDIHFQDGRHESVRPDNSSGGTGADPMAFPHDYHRGAIADFAASIREKRAPRIPGREVLRVHRLIDALLETSRTGLPVAVAG
ncbi:MAG: Gfo/Idh/MocA family oxidoreductase [Beijerinckiaceae bacterium]|jgi:UDP-N-acetyl-2-amino-2-deoxyglucuronate dehydrogenase|nr:Gfo/Idh/MocA family oxidoreductase [Beijerinckiaceae bacterium]